MTLDGIVYAWALHEIVDLALAKIPHGLVIAREVAVFVGELADPLLADASEHVVSVVLVEPDVALRDRTERSRMTVFARGRLEI